MSNQNSSEFNWDGFNHGEYGTAFKPNVDESIEGDVERLDTRESRYNDGGAAEYPVVTIKRRGDGKLIAWHCSSFGAIRAVLEVGGVQVGDRVRITRLADAGEAKRFEVHKAAHRVVEPADSWADWT
jgi:hypothetical protein